MSLFRYRIVKVSFLLVSMVSYGLCASAHQDETRTSFFATDLTGEIDGVLFRYYGTALDIQFGVKLVPRHSLAFGIRLPHKGSGSGESFLIRTFPYDSAILLKYDYDFRNYNTGGIPGASASLFFGDNPGVRDRFTGGISADIFFKKFA